MTTATKNAPAALTVSNQILRLDGRVYDLTTTAGAKAFLASGNFDLAVFPEGLDVAELLVSAAQKVSYVGGMIACREVGKLMRDVWALSVGNPLFASAR